ncbi:Translation machinery-associated protein 22 [Dispira parvispora]|uniref:Translation machinery-associated protein 22 n=1 Tax=Dispira parvispora TaxID=1520584 RepID=A0A9W8ATT7_9FUNG|nr:Translation machinery-associated protein 22 [Dispira parvispora]
MTSASPSLASHHASQLRTKQVTFSPRRLGPHTLASPMTHSIYSPHPNTPNSSNRKSNFAAVYVSKITPQTSVKSILKTPVPTPTCPSFIPSPSPNPRIAMDRSAASEVDTGEVCDYLQWAIHIWTVYYHKVSPEQTSRGWDKHPAWESLSYDQRGEFYAGLYRQLNGAVLPTSTGNSRAGEDSGCSNGEESDTAGESSDDFFSESVAVIPEDSEVGRTVVAHSSLFFQAFVTDLRANETGVLAQYALRCLTLWFQLPSCVAQSDPDELGKTLRYIAKQLKMGQDRVVGQACLKILEGLTLPTDDPELYATDMFDMFHQLILLHRNNLPYFLLAARGIDALFLQFPDLVRTKLHLWLLVLSPVLLHNRIALRTKVMTIFKNALFHLIDKPWQKSSTNLLKRSTIKTILLPRLEDMVQSMKDLQGEGEKEFVGTAWGVITGFLSHHVDHNSVLNPLLKVLERYFNGEKERERLTAYVQWKMLCYVLAQNKRRQHEKLAQVILVPITNALEHSQNSRIRLAAIRAWVWLLYALGSGLSQLFTLMIEPIVPRILKNQTDETRMILLLVCRALLASSAPTLPWHPSRILASFSPCPEKLLDITDDNSDDASHPDEICRTQPSESLAILTQKLTREGIHVPTELLCELETVTTLCLVQGLGPLDSDVVTKHLSLFLSWFGETVTRWNLPSGTILTSPPKDTMAIIQGELVPGNVQSAVSTVLMDESSLSPSAADTPTSGTWEQYGYFIGLAGHPTPVIECHLAQVWDRLVSFVQRQVTTNSTNTPVKSSNGLYLAELSIALENLAQLIQKIHGKSSSSGSTASGVLAKEKTPVKQSNGACSQLTILYLVDTLMQRLVADSSKVSPLLYYMVPVSTLQRVAGILGGEVAAQFYQWYGIGQAGDVSAKVVSPEASNSLAEGLNVKESFDVKISAGMESPGKSPYRTRSTSQAGRELESQPKPQAEAPTVRTRVTYFEILYILVQNLLGIISHRKNQPLEWKAVERIHRNCLQLVVRCQEVSLASTHLDKLPSQGDKMSQVRQDPMATLWAAWVKMTEPANAIWKAAARDISNDQVTSQGYAFVNTSTWYSWTQVLLGILENATDQGHQVDERYVALVARVLGWPVRGTLSRSLDHLLITSSMAPYWHRLFNMASALYQHHVGARRFRLEFLLPLCTSFSQGWSAILGKECPPGLLYWLRLGATTLGNTAESLPCPSIENGDAAKLDNTAFSGISCSGESQSQFGYLMERAASALNLAYQTLEQGKSLPIPVLKETLGPLICSIAQSCTIYPPMLVWYLNSQGKKPALVLALETWLGDPRGYIGALMLETQQQYLTQLRVILDGLSTGLPAERTELESGMMGYLYDLSKLANQHTVDTIAQSKLGKLYSPPVDSQDRQEYVEDEHSNSPVELPSEEPTGTLSPPSLPTTDSHSVDTTVAEESVSTFVKPVAQPSTPVTSVPKQATVDDTTQIITPTRSTKTHYARRSTPFKRKRVQASSPTESLPNGKTVENEPKPDGSLVSENKALKRCPNDTPHSCALKSDAGSTAQSEPEPSFTSTIASGSFWTLYKHLSMIQGTMDIPSLSMNELLLLQKTTLKFSAELLENLENRVESSRSPKNP